MRWRVIGAAATLRTFHSRRTSKVSRRIRHMEAGKRFGGSRAVRVLSRERGVTYSGRCSRAGHLLFSSSASLAILLAMRRASSFVSSLAAERRAGGTRSQLAVLIKQDFTHRTVQV